MTAPKPVQTVGAALCAILAAGWLFLMVALIDFGKGMGGAQGSTSDYLSGLLWPGIPGVLVFAALGYAAWRNAVFAAALCGLVALFAGWLALFL